MSGLPATAAPAPAATRARSDFRLYWLAGSASQFGSYASALVIPLLVLSLGGSPGTAGLLATATAGCRFGLAPIAGVYADRWPRRTMMAVAALVAGAAMAAVAVGVATGRLTLPVLVAAAMVEGVAAAAFTAAASGSVRRLLPPDEPQRGIAALRAGEQGARLAGPAAGGVLYQLAGWAPFLLDAVSYAVAAACVRAVRTDLDPEPSGRSRPSWRAELAAGVRYLLGQPFLRFVTLWAAGVNLAFGVLYFHVILVARLAGASAVAIGAVLTVAAVGGLAGALLAPRLLRRVRPTAVVFTASWVMAVAVVPLALTSTTWMYGLLLAMVSLVSPAVGIVFQSRAIMVVPDSLQARVGTAMGTLGHGAGVLAPVLAGLLTTVDDRRVIATAFGLALAVLAAYATANLRHLPRPPAARAGE